MTSGLDDLFYAHELEPPEGFSRRVMSRLEHLPDAGSDRRPPAWLPAGPPAWLPWAAVICGTVLGLDELAGFMFSAWLAAAAH